MKIEVLYIDGCPHFPATIDAVKRVLWQRGVICPMVETRVGDQDMAVSLGFLGSPTVRINGLDIEPSARQRTAYGMMCRTYEGSGVPPEDLILNAITKEAHRDLRTGAWRQPGATASPKNFCRTKMEHTMDGDQLLWLHTNREYVEAVERNLKESAALSELLERMNWLPRTLEEKEALESQTANWTAARAVVKD